MSRGGVTGQTSKVVYNSCYGGFGLSEEALQLYESLSDQNDISEYTISRDDPLLIEVIKKLGKKANDKYSKLAITEILGPWHISEYDGVEDVISDVYTTQKLEIESLKIENARLKLKVLKEN